jgi:hypothetical protein
LGDERDFDSFILLVLEGNMKGTIPMQLWAACLVLPILALAGCEDASESPLQPVDVPIQASHGADPAAPVLTFNGFLTVGTSHIVRTPNAVNYRLSTTGLEPGHAYTMWIVIFNDPGNCADPDTAPGCGPTDVVNDAARPDMMYAAGAVVGGSGEATFAGSRHVGDSNGSINGPVGLPAYGLEDPAGAGIQLVVHHHGPMIPAYLPDMTQTVDGGCIDAGIPAPGANSPWNNNAFGARGPNTCQSVQFAVHAP